MFVKIIRGLINIKNKKAEKIKSELLEKAEKFRLTNDRNGAIRVYEDYLLLDPYNVEVLCSYGSCLADIERKHEAFLAFELAHSLDDTNLNIMANYAQMLLEKKRGKEAFAILRQAKIYSLDIAHVDAVYTSACLMKGDAIQASRNQLKIWLSNFDDLRYANSYLFYCMYSGITEEQIASEHHFWADTLLTNNFFASNKYLSSNKFAKEEDQKNKLESYESRKIRIGYWSPDFRDHSVRYFFRPMLENHDLKKVELFLYHDSGKSDTQTELIKNSCERFYDVYGKTNEELVEFILSHNLDVLVELAGHSSFNRLSLLKKQLAVLQVTALGYPPTTGIDAIDVKIVDKYIITSEFSRYYAEYPFVMPSSFWCFDPIEDIPEPLGVPSLGCKYITFGCIGSTAKITKQTLQNWKTILEKLPSSKLLIRAVNFYDDFAKTAILERIAEMGIPLDRVELKQPLAPKELFSSYNEIDIILDTYPFNGGTTSCFATYMGVPIITIAGKSLVSRMGFSIMSNLGYPELVAFNDNEYIDKAIETANNIELLKKFKLEARSKFKESSLGNGKRFTQEFEEACLNLLNKKQQGLLTYESNIKIFPADKIIGRAYSILGYGQVEAAERVLNYCLRHYPNSGSAHIMRAQNMSGDDKFEQRINYLESRLDTFSVDEQASVLITMTRFYILLQKMNKASIAIDRLLEFDIKDDFDRSQVRLYDGYRYSSLGNTKISKSKILTVNDGIFSLRVLIVCDSTSLFNFLVKQMRGTCICPEGFNIKYIQCIESLKIEGYQDLLAEEDKSIIVIIQKNIEIHNENFYFEIVESLISCDIVSFSGAFIWRKIDWRTDEFEVKAAGFFVSSDDLLGGIEMQFFGTSQRSLVQDLCVLDGRLLAFKPITFQKIDFDLALKGESTLLEDDWSHCAFNAGLRLAAHRNLGVFLNQQAVPGNSKEPALRLHIADKLNLDVFAFSSNSDMAISAPVKSFEQACEIAYHFLKD